MTTMPWSHLGKITSGIARNFLKPIQDKCEDPTANDASVRGD